MYNYAFITSCFIQWEAVVTVNVYIRTDTDNVDNSVMRIIIYSNAVPSYFSDTAELYHTGPSYIQTG